MGDRAEGELAALVAELEELLAERDIEMARPMRGAERERLRRSYEREEERLRAQIALLTAGPGPAAASDGSDER
ncbi:MAG: hypothetical protein M1389_06070 [Chloroflexi bacterium]|nr:hypothetical protein [Chloroflexota bacterium]